MYVSFNRMWYNKKQAVKKTGRGSYRKWKGKKMKKKLIAVIAGVFLMGSLTGCSSQLSNEYITIKQYKGLEVPQVEATELTDDQVTNYVNYFLQADATRTEVTDRAAQTGDTVNIDYVGKVDGVEFQGGSAQGTDLELGSGSFIGANGDYQGFEDQIVGHNKGEQFDITVQFPDTYMNTEMAGKVAVFTITLNGIYTVDVPKLTDKWVKENSVEATTVKEYKKEINLFWNHLELAITQFSYTKEWISNMKKEGLHVYILSNYGDWTYQRTKDNALDFLLLTDGDIFSYSVRQVKPDVEIYETLLKKYQLTADECVFIDDRMENIEGAKKAGIHGICFETIGQVKEDLKKYNIYV